MTGEVIGVVGPPLSGATSLAAALRHRLPGHPVREHPDPLEGAAVVVFVVSAAAPMTGSALTVLERARLDAVAGHAVVAAVSKIDVHRTWREMLAANRDAGWIRAAGWVGVAAAPEVGSPRVDDLVAAVRAALRVRRTAQPTAVREVRRRQPVGAERTVARRALIQQARAQLASQARAMCAGLRAEWHQTAATVSPRQAEPFRRDVRRRAAQLADDLDRAVTGRLAEVAGSCGLAGNGAAALGPPPDPAPELVYPPVRSLGVENRLTGLLGGGFGVGAAVTLDRLLAGVGTPTAGVASLAAGVGLGAWVAHTRRVLSARSTLDRWIDEVSVALRTALEERIAARVLAADIDLSAAGGTGPLDRLDRLHSRV